MTFQFEAPIVILTGAGISAESGIPTFRGEGGLWRNFRPEELATPQAFKRDPKLVWEWYTWRRELVSKCEPNAAHRTLVEMEVVVTAAMSGDAQAFTLITQNVDGLHEAAGSQNVVTLHGSLWSMRCVREGRRFEDRRLKMGNYLLRCPNCDAPLRPDVVWFGEMLDETVLQKAYEASERARTMIVIGTSALVHPAASLPIIAKRNSARLIEVNPEETPLSPYVDETLRGPAAVELPRWWKLQHP